jgi:outer membrane receptor protein involved in Fe transport
MKTIGLHYRIRSGLAGIILLIMIILQAGFSHGQEITSVKITGIVTDLTDNEAIPGVNVYIKGTQTGSVTDVNGKYAITIPKGSILVYTMVGYETQEILIENQLLVNVQMKASVTSLDEVVVIGYGSTTKKEITGSIATVKEEGFNRGVYNNPIGLLQGKVAGLNIVKPDGADPQAGYNIILRGTNTLTSGQGPLIIVDGIAGVDLKNVSPEEVESMDVLKDGSAATESSS